jgi:predicted AlkP superfamily phosphohydrolase/phosphomutase
METWLCGKSVATHNAQASQRRLPYCAPPAAGWQNWSALFTHLDRVPNEELVKFDEKGQRYAKVAADWDNVIDRYEQALARALEKIHSYSRTSIVRSLVSLRCRSKHFPADRIPFDPRDIPATKPGSK